MMFKVMAYGYQCGIYSSRALEEACQYRIDFMWLLKDSPAPDHSTIARFRTGRCAEAVEELFYQYVKERGAVDHDVVFIDGTKLESRAGRYTFRWRRSIEKALSKVRESVRAAIGMQTLEELRTHLENTCPAVVVHGSGHRKSPEQRYWDELKQLENRWAGYVKSLEIMGSSRNSYSKTDPDATFMRMKEDHMRNGQLKPGYNIQAATNSEFITGIEAFSNRTDVGTLVPFLQTMQFHHRKRYAEVAADAGYESLENYLYLRRESTELHHGQLVTTGWYRCENCSSCPCRATYCKAKNAEHPKEIMLRKTFWKKREQSQQNITTEHGIHLRLCRSIQSEGTFALLKKRLWLPPLFDPGQSKYPG